MELYWTSFEPHTCHVEEKIDIMAYNYDLILVKLWTTWFPFLNLVKSLLRTEEPLI